MTRQKVKTLSTQNNHENANRTPCTVGSGSGSNEGFLSKLLRCGFRAKYTNDAKCFASYFINFGEGRTRLELMTQPNIQPNEGKRGYGMGLAHFAISVGGKDKVDALTERLRKDNFTIFSEPRITGDGYYESVVLDPEGNYVEITA